MLLPAALTPAVYGQERSAYAYGDHWYDNPLGFSPLNLHTKNGFLVPALVVAAGLLLTDRDTTLEHRWAFFEETGVSWGYKQPHTTMYQSNTGFAAQLRKWCAVGAGLTVYHPSDAFNNTWGIGLRPFARFYPINTRTFRLYFESGAGLIYFADEFPQPAVREDVHEPRLGTRLNGSPRYGIGADFTVYDRWSAQVGIAHVHISNGNAIGADRNPSHDSNGVFFGLIYRP